MYLGEPRKTKENHCPFCNHILDGISQINGENLPSPGDVTICIKCGNVSVFDDALGLRKPNLYEADGIQKDPTILKMQRAIFDAHVAIDSKGNHGYGNA